MYQNSFICVAAASVLGCNWIWYKNGMLLDEGIDMCIIKVKQSGDYQVWIWLEKNNEQFEVRSNKRRIVSVGAMS